jgi:hypothetical protein
MSDADGLRGERMYQAGRLESAAKFVLADLYRVRRLAKASKYERESADRRLARSEGMLLGVLYASRDVEERADRWVKSIGVEQEAQQ